MGTDRLRPIRQSPSNHPSRTCVGCRQRDDRSALLRVVVERRGDGAGVVVVADPRRRLPGRGAWLHPTAACLDVAIRRKAFGRALRVKVALDVRAVTAYVTAHEQSVVVGSTRELAQGTESGLRADEHPMSTQR